MIYKYPKSFARFYDTIYHNLRDEIAPAHRPNTSYLASEYARPDEVIRPYNEKTTSKKAAANIKQRPFCIL
jgi:hypothetical protein